MLNADNYPPNQPVTNNFFVGFNIDTYNNQAGSRIGSMHWGAAPQGRWVGELYVQPVSSLIQQLARNQSDRGRLLGNPDRQRPDGTKCR
jgi:hypothetical protein